MMAAVRPFAPHCSHFRAPIRSTAIRQSGPPMKAFHRPLLALLVCALSVMPAAADPVVDAFYARCTAENAYQLPPGDLDGACACMAPVLASFLTADARRQIEDAIKSGKPVSFAGSPFKGNPADLARSAIAQCPAVGEAMYRQKCAGNSEGAPACREMRKMLDTVP
jgi:hypothetical protein